MSKGSLDTRPSARCRKTRLGASLDGRSRQQELYSSLPKGGDKDAVAFVRYCVGRGLKGEVELCTVLWRSQTMLWLGSWRDLEAMQPRNQGTEIMAPPLLHLEEPNAAFGVRGLN